MKKQIKKTLAACLTAALSLSALAGCSSQPAPEVAEVLGLEEDDLVPVEEHKGTKGDEQFITELDAEKYIKVGDYRNLALEEPEVEPEEADVQYIFDAIYSNYAEYVDAERLVTEGSVAEGDIINLDYAGYRDGVAFDGGSAQNQTLWIGSDTFIDGFEDGLIGVAVGDTVDLNLTFPENYGNGELAGAAVVFTCTVNGIIPPEAIYEAFAEYELEDGAAYTADEAGLRDYSYDYVKNYLLQSVDKEGMVVDALLEIVEVKKEFPTSLIEAYQNSFADTLNRYAQQYEVEADEVANYFFGVSADRYIKENSYQALLTDAALWYIANQENLMFTEEELQNRMQGMADDYGYESVDALLEAASSTMDEYRVYLMEDDVISFLLNENGQQE